MLVCMVVIIVQSVILDNKLNHLARELHFISYIKLKKKMAELQNIEAFFFNLNFTNQMFVCLSGQLTKPAHPEYKS